jgi:hypothetical protein
MLDTLPYHVERWVVAVAECPIHGWGCDQPV